LTSRFAGPVLAIVGVTASGKSALAMELARRLGNVELISIDSMQIYRGMDIGTAKPTLAERDEVPHHLIDIADPHEDFSVSRFQCAAREAIVEVEKRGSVPVLVGGTGLHLRAVVDDLRIPGQYPDTRFVMVGPRWPRTAIDERIVERYRRQIVAGFVDEVRALAASPQELSRTACQALGYRQLLEHVRGEVALDEAVEDAVTATRRFARRQERWFRRDPRIAWIDVASNPMEALDELMGQWNRIERET
jgi:tRNA dimethylallyltransferase